MYAFCLVCEYLNLWKHNFHLEYQSHHILKLQQSVYRCTCILVASLHQSAALHSLPRLHHLHSCRRRIRIPSLIETTKEMAQIEILSSLEQGGRKLAPHSRKGILGTFLPVRVDSDITEEALSHIVGGFEPGESYFFCFF